MFSRGFYFLLCSLIVQFDVVGRTSFSSIEYRRWICIWSWRSGERKPWIKQDLRTTHGLVICAECDLLVEVSHEGTYVQFSPCCTFNMYSSHPDSTVSSESSESSSSKAKKKENTPNGLDNSRQVTIFKKWTTTLSLKQDMFRSFNDHLQLWIRLQVWLN